ncbi:ABC transporter substrate-binding protein [Microbacter sp. GSS18]|nr:ABC transporter substrate-binding protein [Microbacter sp. GSS18]
MQWRKRALGTAALMAVGSLALAGCSGDSGGDEDATGDSSAVIVTNGSEPENPLIPTNTNETGGAKILTSIFAGLIYYDVDGNPVNDMAEDITVDDPQHLTVTLKQGQTFTDGEEVTADNFINAWNYGALLSNAQLNSYFFEDIEGFSWDEDSELTGLEQVDDYTFTIALNKPASDFALRLGYPAFSPLPDVAFEDIDAFGQNPVGNGPYKLASEDAWQHDVQIDLVVNEDYQGGRQPANGGLSIVFYATPDAAYADLLGGVVDVIDLMPQSALATFESDLGDRAVNQPAAIFQSFTIPERLEHFSGEEGQLRRQAISMAIDREAITETIFQSTRTPASDFTSPVIAGWSDSLEGADVLVYDEQAAQDLWAQADEISPWSGTFELAYNSDGPHQAWVDATANSISNVLGIEAYGDPYVDFATLRTEVNAGTIETAFRTGWQADYPGLYNFLGPLYATNAGSNDGDYSSAEFDAFLSEGISNGDLDEQNALFQQAQEVLLEDLPAIPLWYQNVVGGYADTVENVAFGWDSVPLYDQITKAE